MSSAGATVPTDNRMLGPTAAAVEPVIRQLFIGRGADDPSTTTTPSSASSTSSAGASRHAVRRLGHPARRRYFYIPSLSCRTIVYKGMLNADQLTAFYPDLRDRGVESALALVHSRFRTNTFPSWARAHPYRLHRPQRRDQHAARQRQLDARPREHVRSRRCSATTSQKLLPGHRRPTAATRRCSTTSLELLVLGGPLAAARDDDDDPRAVGEPRDDDARRRRPSTSTTPA